MTSQIVTSTWMIVAVCSCVCIVNGYPFFQDRIPNGKHVPHPCKPNYVWYGVGHTNSKGGGERNAFGKAFRDWGSEWNECLCREDSDGDGKSNGEELGDPRCVWSVGQAPERTTGVTHPGICDPFVGSRCAGRNDWVDCAVTSQFTCDAINQTDVQPVALNIDRTLVPNTDTTYMCQAFNLTTKLPPGESHMIAVTPRLDNRNVMHHILVYACNETAGVTAMDLYGTPAQCGMQTTLCPSVIAVWTVGIDGTCLDENFGFPMGVNGYKTVIMELHWNNPEERSDYYDGSGVNLYVKQNKRANDGGTWIVGPYGLVLPTGFPSYTQASTCNSECTNIMLDQPIYITDLLPHMHYLGTSFLFEVYRGGVQIYRYKLDKYFYDSPELVQFKTPLEVRPGDEIKVNCTFQTLNQKKTVFFGEATSDEMCFAILTYYPFTKTVADCTGMDNYTFCNGSLRPVKIENLCRDLETMYGGLWSPSIASSCDVNGAVCQDNCEAALSTVKNTDCYQGNASAAVQALMTYSPNGKEFVSRLRSCDARPEVIPGGTGSGQTSVCGVTPTASGAARVVPSAGLGTLMAITVYIGWILNHVVDLD